MVSVSFHITDVGTKKSQLFLSKKRKSPRPSADAPTVYSPTADTNVRWGFSSVTEASLRPEHRCVGGKEEG